ncbi:hypothetical protein V8C35DRAFT_294829 [Trichoderma chlorosporum]
MSIDVIPEPDYVSNQESASDSLSKEPRVKVEGSPLLQSPELQAEPPITQLAKDGSRTRTVSTSFTTWWPEILSCVATVGVFLALLLTLRRYEGETISSWPFAITLNTFVSICTLLIKTLLGLILSNGIGQLKWVWYRKAHPLIHLQAYDSASRGVIGSLELLWIHRGRQMIPTMGALLVILLTLVDPFGQALIRLDSCMVPDPSVASTINAVHLSDLVGYHGNSGSIKDVVYDAQDLITMGIANKDLIPTIGFDCPTGNCSYPVPYHSAGYCSRCKDSSEELTVNLTKSFNVTWEAANITVLAYESGEVLGITTNTSAQEVDNLGTFQILAGELSKCVDNATTPWRCRGYGAATCEIYACVLSYKGNITNGALTETIVNTSEVWAVQNTPYTLKIYGSIDASCLNASEVASLKQAGYNFSQDTPWLGYSIPPMLDTYNTTIAGAIVRPECLYVIDDVLKYSIPSFFDTFIGNPSVTALELGTGGAINGDMKWLNLWDYGAMDYSDVQRSFDGLAEAMTYYGRTYPSTRIDGMGEDGFVNGTSYRLTSCIEIQWAWATYLAVVLLGAIMFLFGIMILTRRDLEVNGQDYKTSILPLLFHGTQLMDNAESYQELKFMKEISKEAENIYVQFKDIDKRWQFREKKNV